MKFAECNAERAKIIAVSSFDILCNNKNILCEWNSLLIYPEIDYNNYKLEIELKNFENNSQILKYKFNVFTLNPKFFLLIFLIKLIFLFSSIASFYFYYKFYKSLNVFIRTFEHKAIFVISIGLILFNDPLSIVSLYTHSIALNIFTSLTSSIFITLLIYLWIIMLERIHKEPTTPETKLYKSKIYIIFGNIYLFL